MVAQPPSHRERFIAAVGACVALIDDAQLREDTERRLSALRSSGESGRDEVATVKRLASAVRKTGTIDSDEAQRIFALFMRNGGNWPEMLKR